MEWYDELARVLKKSAARLPEDVGLLFSGGLDSSLLAWLIKKGSGNVHLYSSGTQESHDRLWTAQASSLLGLPLKFLTRGDEDIIRGLKTLKELTGEESPLTLLIELPLYFVCSDSDEQTLVSGQGADELFLGYKKYESNDTSRNDLKRVVEEVCPLERRIAVYYGKELEFPYLSEGVVDVAGRIPSYMKIRDGQRKYILRSTASRLLLDERIAWKQKKASQYSSGFKSSVERIAKDQGKKIHEFIRDL